MVFVFEVQIGKSEPQGTMFTKFKRKFWNKEGFNCVSKEQNQSNPHGQSEQWLTSQIANENPKQEQADSKKNGITRLMLFVTFTLTKS